MTTKDYFIIAGVLRETRKSVGNVPGADLALTEITERFKRELLADNPRFDARKFEIATRY